MITKDQLGILAKHFQVDQNTIAREYLQVLFLSYLYQRKEANKIYFKGGTAIHLLFNSPRFSEDLDFSTEFSQKEIRKIIQRTEGLLENELAGLQINSLYSGKRGIRFRIKYQAKDFKYPLNIRLDFNQERVERVLVSPIVTKFPIEIFPLVSHLEEKEILAEKIRALMTRGKGRDLFDLWFLLEKDVRIDDSLVKKKLKIVGKKFSQRALLEKIKNFSLRDLRLDLNQFLPQSQRQIIEVLKEKLLSRLQRKKS